MTQAQRWIITTSGERELQEVTKDLNGAGFSVDQVFGEIGSITGSASEELIENLRAIPGIADVSREESVDIGPPDAPITW